MALTNSGLHYWPSPLDLNPQQLWQWPTVSWNQEAGLQEAKLCRPLGVLLIWKGFLELQTFNSSLNRLSSSL